MINQRAFAEIVLHNIPSSEASEYVDIKAIEDSIKDEEILLISKTTVSLLLSIFHYNPTAYMSPEWLIALGNIGKDALWGVNRKDCEFNSRYMNNFLQLIVGGLIFNKEGCILERISAKKINAVGAYYQIENTLELVCGHVSSDGFAKNENLPIKFFEDNLRREITEETTLYGYNLRLPRMRCIPIYTNGSATDYAHFCLAYPIYVEDTDLSKISSNEPDKHKIEFIPWEELYLHLDKFSQWVINMLRHSSIMSDYDLLPKVFKNINKDLLG